MVHFSKVLLNIWLLIFLVISIPYTFMALINFGRRGFATNRTCLMNIVWIPFSYGICMYMLSVIGIIGSICRVKPLQSLFNLILNISILFTLCVTLFSLFAFPLFPVDAAWLSVYKNGVPWTQVYPPLMRSTLVDDGKWSNVEQCLEGIQLCDTIHKHKYSDVSLDHDLNLNNRTQMFYGFLIKGCCYPPRRCGLVKKNSSEYEWEASSSKSKQVANNDPECQAWIKIRNGMCYDCDTCKASYMAKFHQGWRMLTKFHSFFIFFIVFVTLFTTCGAFTEPEREYDNHPPSPPPWR